MPETVKKRKEEILPTNENVDDHAKCNSDIKLQKGVVKALGKPEVTVNEDADSTKDVSCNSELKEAAPGVK